MVSRLEKKRKMDANTRKLRDDLEARERTFKRARKEEDDDKIALQNEIERLREDGLRKLREIVRNPLPSHVAFILGYFRS